MIKFGRFKENGELKSDWDEHLVDISFFPDGTQRILTNYYPFYNCDDSKNVTCTIVWKYEHEYELFTVIAVAEHLIELGLEVDLFMPYIPNARMDRVKFPQEIFTLKTFCKLINQVGFRKVYVMDANSNVSLALLDRVSPIDIREIVYKLATVQVF